jgi:hypothetical protein
VSGSLLLTETRGDVTRQSKLCESGKTELMFWRPFRRNRLRTQRDERSEGNDGKLAPVRTAKDTRVKAGQDRKVDTPPIVKQ